MGVGAVALQGAKGTIVSRSPKVRVCECNSSTLCGQAPNDCLIVASDVSVDEAGSSVALRLTAIGKKTVWEAIALME